LFVEQLKMTLLGQANRVLLMAIAVAPPFTRTTVASGSLKDSVLLQVIL
jgi:hypothetical protein